MYSWYIICIRNTFCFIILIISKFILFLIISIYYIDIIRNKINLLMNKYILTECFTKWLKLDQNKQGHPRPYALRALHIEHKSVQTCTPAATCVCKDTRTPNWQNDNYVSLASSRLEKKFHMHKRKQANHCSTKDMMLFHKVHYKI